MKLNLTLGQHVEGFLKEDGLPFYGKIIGFCKDPSQIHVETVSGHREYALIDTLILVPIQEFKISRKALIAQIRNSSEDAFKSQKDARDFLLRLVYNLERVSDFEK